MSRKYLLYPALLLLIVGGNALAQPSTGELLECAGYFKAREQWLQKINGNPATVNMYESYSKTLVALAHNDPSNIDWGMVSGATNSGNPSYQRQVNARARDIMLSYAQNGYSGLDLPLCMEDADCIQCSKLLKGQQ